MKIKMFNVRDEEKDIALEWAKKNNVELYITSESFNVKNIDSLKGFDGITLSQIGKLDDTAYEKLSSIGIKQISQRSAGFDMYNLDLATKNNIIITNVPSYSPESIAEYTVLTAMNIIRKNNLIKSNVQKHDFRWMPLIRGRVMGDMKVAIVGTGKIGYYTAKFFKGFGCNVFGYDLYPNDNVREVLEYKSSIEEAVKDADIISIHIPATKENTHLFNKDMFSKFKKGAILLNMARGAIVDTNDLLDALDNDILSGAGIDTYENEQDYIPKDWSNKDIKDELFLRLINHEKVMYSPHIAFYTDEAIKNLVEGGLNATKEIIETGNTKTRVN